MFLIYKKRGNDFFFQILTKIIKFLHFFFYLRCNLNTYVVSNKKRKDNLKSMKPGRLQNLGKTIVARLILSYTIKRLVFFIF